MMPLADLAQLAIAGKNRVAGRRRIVVGESIILAGDDGDGHDALQVSASRAASAVLPCPQALPRPIARFAERRSGCGPQFRHRTPEGAQGLTTENCTRAAIEGYGFPTPALALDRKKLAAFSPPPVDFCSSRLALGAATERARALAMRAGTRAQVYKRDSSGVAPASRSPTAPCSERCIGRPPKK